LNSLDLVARQLKENFDLISAERVVAFGPMRSLRKRTVVTGALVVIEDDRLIEIAKVFGHGL
jgi:hypothetical protein